MPPVDDRDLHTLARLVLDNRVAALGTTRGGQPYVSMILYAAAPSFSALYIHASGLAQHTRNIAKDPRVGLMISEPDAGTADPQTLARVSIRSEAVVVTPEDPAYEAARLTYVQRHPEAAPNFQLGDFSLYRIEPLAARYVAGFGRIYNLRLEDFQRASEL